MPIVRVQDCAAETSVRNNGIATMPSKLNKVHKHVAKKKGAKINALHENSRDALRLRKAGVRDERVARVNSLREKANRPWLDRVAFFRDHLPDTLHPLTLEEMQALIRQFVGRHDEELAQLQAERRPGRPPVNRQTVLDQQIKADRQEHHSGFWVPNFQDEETLLLLETWSGDWAGLSTLRFVRIDEDGNVNESQFPPRGAS